jgi:hypothetical protein
MPAYWKLSLSYSRAALPPDFIRCLYQTMLDGDFAYGGVLAWYCPGDLELEEVIRWNQERLDRDFVLGFKEHVANDYRQIIAKHPRFRECRVIIRHGAHCVGVIVTESDLCKGALQQGGIHREQIEPLKQLALTLWHKGWFTSVQTYGEYGKATTYDGLKTGHGPSILPFAIVDSVCYAACSWTFGRGPDLRISRLGKGGFLIENEDLVS